MACYTLQQKTTNRGRENTKPQDLQRQEGSGEFVWNPGKQGLTGHNGVKPKVVRDIITSAKEVMFSPGFVCGFLSLFVNKITQKLMDGF